MLITPPSPQELADPHTLKSFARKIACAFKDNANYRLYLVYCQRYPMAVIWRAFTEVDQMPYERITKSKGALFNYLVQKYAKEREQHDTPGATGALL